MRRKSTLTTCWLIFLFFCAPGFAQDTLSEYQVKAAYLFNFLKFAEYPNESFADPLAPIVIGVVGEDPFGSMLPHIVIGKTVQGRDLVIRMYRAGEELRGAHILFLSASEKKRLPHDSVQLAWIERPHRVGHRRIPRCGRDDSVSDRKRPCPVCNQRGCNQPGQAETEFQIIESGEGGWRKWQGNR